ncbi:MAG TPA: AI-2E family transporter [Clostridia bacterium]|nr:AI-2E family transporter [Clostridia bacterium]
MKEIISKWGKWMYWFTFSLAVILIYKTLDNFNEIGLWFSKFFEIIAPFLGGILISYLLYMPVKKFENIYGKVKKIKMIQKKSRVLSIATVYILALGIIVLMFKFIIPVIVESILDLVNNFQQYYNMAVSMINELPEESILRSPTVMNSINEAKNIDPMRYINVEKLTEYAQGVMSFAAGILDFFVAIIVSIYILAQRTQIIAYGKKIVDAMCKKNVAKNIDKYFHRGSEIFFGFVTSQLLDAIVVGVLTSIVMSIMGIKYAVLLGFMIGLFNLIPYFGAIIAIIIAGLITVLTGGPSQALWMVIIVTIIQQIDANIINPKIIGGTLKISPLLVIFAVTVGGAYFGVLGMFLAVPVAAVLKELLNDYIENKKIQNI